jgi:hypothetical protein
MYVIEDASGEQTNRDVPESTVFAILTKTYGSESLAQFVLVNLPINTRLTLPDFRVLLGWGFHFTTDLPYAIRAIEDER